MKTFEEFKKDKINEIIHKQLSDLYAQPVNTYNPFSVSNDPYWGNNLVSDPYWGNTLVNDSSTLRTHTVIDNPYSTASVIYGPNSGYDNTTTMWDPFNIPKYTQ